MATILSPRREVTTLSKQIIDALVAGDTKSLDGFLVDDWIFIGPLANVMSKADQMKVLNDGTVDYVAIEPSEVKLRVYGDPAFTTGRYLTTYQFKNKGQVQELKSPVRFSHFYAKQGGKWRQVSTHLTGIGREPVPMTVKSGEKP